MKVILASSSQARLQVMKQTGIIFEVMHPDIDESLQENEPVVDYVLRLSIEKAQAIAKKTKKNRSIIIGADQVAVCDNIIYGKPLTHDNALEYLKIFCSKELIFYSGLCVLDSETNLYSTSVTPTKIKMKAYSDQEIELYLQYSRVLNCAGGIMVEGTAAALFERYEACDPTAIYGLPLMSLNRSLEEFGLSLLSLNNTNIS